MRQSSPPLFSHEVSDTGYRWKEDPELVRLQSHSVWQLVHSPVKLYKVYCCQTALYSPACRPPADGVCGKPSEMFRSGLERGLEIHFSVDAVGFMMCIVQKLF